MGISQITRLYQIIFIILATYGILYFSYKFYHPSVGGADFFNYYHMYLKPLDFSQEKAPFIYRQFSAVITNFIYETGIYYPNDISFSKLEYKQEVFFSAIFSNYIALVLTAIVVSAIINLKTERNLLVAPVLGGILCFLSFFTQLSVITGLSEGWSWFLVAVAFYGYTARNMFVIFPVLALAIFQRETILIIFFVIACIDWLFNEKTHKTFFLYTAISSAFFFVSHILVRTILLPVPNTVTTGGNHLNLGNMFPNLLESLTPSTSAILQSAVSQNIYMIFVVTLLLFFYIQAKHHKPLNIIRTGIVQITAVFLVIAFIAGLTNIGNNTGRILSLTTPIMAALTAIHFARIEWLLSIIDNPIKQH